MNFYETIFIVDSAPEAIDAEIKKVEDLITANKGEVVIVDRWGMRKLAYEIKKKGQGFYTCIYFKGDSGLPAILEAQYKLNESCLRYLTVVSIHTPEEVLARVKKAEPETPAEAPAAEAPAAAAAPIAAAAAAVAPDAEKAEEAPPAEESEESPPAEEEPAEEAPAEEAPAEEAPAEEAPAEEAVEEAPPAEESTEPLEEESKEEATEEKPDAEEEPTPEEKEEPEKKE